LYSDSVGAKAKDINFFSNNAKASVPLVQLRAFRPHTPNPKARKILEKTTLLRVDVPIKRLGTSTSGAVRATRPLEQLDLLKG
jgi:hypothetical protein